MSKTSFNTGRFTKPSLTIFINYLYFRFSTAIWILSTRWYTNSVSKLWNLLGGIRQHVTDSDVVTMCRRGQWLIDCDERRIAKCLMTFQLWVDRLRQRHSPHWHRSPPATRYTSAKPAHSVVSVSTSVIPNSSTCSIGLAPVSSLFIRLQSMARQI